MSARMMSLLVAGGVAFSGLPYGGISLSAATMGTPDARLMLQGATLEESGATGTKILLNVPGLVHDPRVQVLPHPDRVVIDLVGVAKGVSPTKQELGAWAGPLVQKVRLAQFVTSPTPITRLVLEVSSNVYVGVTRAAEGVRLELRQGEGSVKAEYVPTGIAPVLSPANLTVVSKEALPAAIAQPVATNTQETLIASGIHPAVTSIETLPVVPDVSTQAQPLSIVPLLPTVLAQDKSVASTSVKRDDGRGRTLGDVQGRYTGSRITIDVKGAELTTFLRIIADHAKLNLVADQDVQGIYDFKFTDTPWDQVLDIIVKHAGLGMEINNGVIRVAKIEKLQKEEDDRKKLAEAKALAGDLVTITRPLSFAKATEAKAIVEKMLTKRGTLIVDERTNVLIISDLEKNLPVVDDLIQQLDVQIQQVQIEARVVEAQGSYEKAFGVKWPTSNSGATKLTVGGSDANWGAFNSPSWNSINSRPTGSTAWLGAYSGGKDGVTSIASPAGELWVSFLSNRLSVNVILQALEKDGKIRIVSNPKVVTQNNKKATILSGAKIPYPTQQSGSTSGAITVSFADANLQLDVTPQITNDGTIIMDLKIEKAEADFSQAVNGTPSILRKYIETQVLVKDGGTAVLGGIYTTSTNAQMTGVPFLSKIPILGFLFRTKSNKENNAELLIFITPRIIKL